MTANDQLRGPCVELSSVSLRFRGRQATTADVQRALEPVHNVLSDLGRKEELDEKLAEYSFFPLTHIFNETQRVSARCLELAVNCLQILVTKGWRRHLSPQMGKQLIILLTLIVGGPPQEEQKTQPAELAISGFDCLSSVFNVLEGREAERTIFHEIGTATVVDRTVYVLLEGIVDDRSDDVCIAAAEALRILYLRISDRVVLASMMPRTVSTLTKVLKPTTQKRRSYRLLVVCLQILTHLLKTVLNDRVAAEEQQDERLVLDESWLRATATQIKLALANVTQIRRHERAEVRDAMLELCVMVIEDCQSTLQESLPMMVETLVVLSEDSPNTAYTTLKHLAITYPVVLDSLKESLHSWITSFPRSMKSNDETVKQHGIRQISTAFQVLSEVQSNSDILTTSLASGLCDSVAAAADHSSLQGPADLSLDVNQNVKSAFPPVLLEHRSQQQTLSDLQSMIARLNVSDFGEEITRSIINQMHGSNSIAPFWLALTFLKNDSLGFDDFIVSDYDNSLSSKAGMIEELYCISLPVLNESLDASQDWRVSALALEAVALQAQQLGEVFRPELMDALYPTLQFLASGNPGLQRHAMTCLNILADSCKYPDVSSMIIDNVDYLVNSVGLKLNTFDVSPYPPQVLLMMVKLCGARLIPYLDDLVDAIFGILNLYHGYPKLVEMMFKTLAAIVEEGTKGPSLLAITDSDKPVDHRKAPYERLQMATLIEDIAARANRAEENDADKVPHPKRPWAETEPQPEYQPDPTDLTELLNRDEEEDDELPPAEPEEKPLSKSHSLLIHIVKSIPAHLSSPSPFLRRSLLSILNQVLPILAHNENSFLPLINDLWPAVVSKITFLSDPPATFNPDLSSSPSSTPSTTAHQEETYVITTALETIETIAHSAGDFLASRIESEYPRWERLYRWVWAKVQEDTNRAIERRTRTRRHPLPPLPNPSHPESQSHALIPSLSLSLSQTQVRGQGGYGKFTPHHTIFRSLISLFTSLLTHVRLPISAGDQICVFLSDWVSVYVGGGYYFDFGRRGRTSSFSSESGPGSGGSGSAEMKMKVEEKVEGKVEEVESVIRAMEVWNADLVWFIFMQKTRVAGGGPTSMSSREGRGIQQLDTVRFAEVVF